EQNKFTPNTVAGMLLDRGMIKAVSDGKNFNLATKDKAGEWRQLNNTDMMSIGSKQTTDVGFKGPNGEDRKVSIGFMVTGAKEIGNGSLEAETKTLSQKIGNKDVLTLEMPSGSVALMEGEKMSVPLNKKVVD